jgi:hypothetical protein
MINLLVVPHDSQYLAMHPYESTVAYRSHPAQHLPNDRFLITWNTTFGQIDSDPLHSGSVSGRVIDRDGSLLGPPRGIVLVDSSYVQARDVFYSIATSEDDIVAVVSLRFPLPSFTNDTVKNIRLLRYDHLGRARWSGSGLVVADDFGGWYATVKSHFVQRNRLVIAMTQFDRWANESRLVVQCVDTMGLRLWGLTGRPLTQWRGLLSPHIYDVQSDGLGGVYIIHNNSYAPSMSTIYLHRVDSNGNAKYGSRGVSINGRDFGSLMVSNLIVDSHGNATVAFTNGLSWVDSVYVQRFDTSGTALWNPGGIALCDSVRNYPYVLADARDGVIVVWFKHHGSSTNRYTLMAQRLDVTGRKLWGMNGVVVKDSIQHKLSGSIVSSGQNQWSVVPDQRGGFIAVWSSQKESSPYDNDIRAQRIDSNGVAKWGWNGTPVCIADSNQWMPEAWSDHHGGAIVAWMDHRNPVPSTGNPPQMDIYAARIDSGGVAYPVELLSLTARLVERTVSLEWVTATETNNLGFDVERLYQGDDPSSDRWERIAHVPGVGTSIREHQYRYVDALSDEALTQETLYYRLKQIDFDGTWNHSSIVRVRVATPKTLSLGPVYPNPARDRAEIGYAVPARMQISLRVYDMLGREVAMFADGIEEAGTHQRSIPLDALPQGVYQLVLRSESGIASLTFLVQR